MHRRRSWHGVGCGWVVHVRVLKWWRRHLPEPVSGWSAKEQQQRAEELEVYA
jgi:hypothetical protein